MIDCLLVFCVLSQLGQADPATLSCRGKALEYTADMSRQLAAVFFVRDRAIAGRRAFEWISISRVSGRYTHFVAFRDEAGNLLPPLLVTAAGCEIVA